MLGALLLTASPAVVGGASARARLETARFALASRNEGTLGVQVVAVAPVTDSAAPATVMIAARFGSRFFDGEVAGVTLEVDSTEVVDTLAMYRQGGCRCGCSYLGCPWRWCAGRNVRESCVVPLDRDVG